MLYSPRSVILHPPAGTACWILTAALAAGLAACETAPERAGEELAWPPAEVIVPPGPPGTSLRRIQDEGVLRWGVDPAGGAPFAMPDPRDPGSRSSWSSACASTWACAACRCRPTGWRSSTT